MRHLVPHENWYRKDAEALYKEYSTWTHGYTNSEGNEEPIVLEKLTERRRVVIPFSSYLYDIVLGAARAQQDTYKMQSIEGNFEETTVLLGEAIWDQAQGLAVEHVSAGNPRMTEIGLDLTMSEVDELIVDCRMAIKDEDYGFDDASFPISNYCDEFVEYASAVLEALEEQYKKFEGCQSIAEICC